MPELDVIVPLMMEMLNDHASLILGISGAVPEFPEIDFKIVLKIRKSVACVGRFGFDLIHSNACEIDVIGRL